VSTVCVADDPTRYLTPPVASGAGDFILHLRISAGLIVGVADWVASHFMGFSPLEEWVAKPLAGDWDAMDRASDAWRNSGRALGAVTTNVNGLPGQVGDSWNGASKDQWATLQAKVSQALGPLPDACVAMGEFAAALGDMARAIAKLIAGALGMLADKGVEIAAEAISVYLSPLLAIDVPIFVTMAVQRAKAIFDAIKEFYETVTQALTIADAIEAALAALTLLSTSLRAAGAASAAASATTRTSTRSAASPSPAGGGGAGGGW
jgi:hypothetical protein